MHNVACILETHQPGRSSYRQIESLLQRPCSLVVLPLQLWLSTLCVGIQSLVQKDMPGNAGEDAIKHLLSRGTHREFGYAALVTMLVVYFLGAVWAAGSAIASGLFVPMLLIGSCIGRIVGLICVDMAASGGHGSPRLALTPPLACYHADHPFPRYSRSYGCSFNRITEPTTWFADVPLGEAGRCFSHTDKRQPCLVSH